MAAAASKPKPESTCWIVGIDLGGTAAKLGLLQCHGDATEQREDDGRVVHSLRAPLPTEQADRTPEAVLALLHDGYTRLVSEATTKLETTLRVAGVGVGFPGQARGGVAVGAANLSPTWQNVPLAEQLSARLGSVPVVLMNDADAALLAEAWVGAAKGRRDVVMITLGTGIGTAALVDGRLLAGSRGLIEGGHMIIERDGRCCGCGQRGCWETYASATSVVTRAREALSKQQEASVLAAVSLGELTAKDVFDAAYEKGDALAGRVVEETAAALGLGCLNLCRVLDPQLLLFAGGMSAAGPRLLERIQHHFGSLGWTVLGHEVEMRVAALGPERAGVVGAAEGARRGLGL